MSDLSKKLSLLLKSKGLTQTEVANKSGISRVALHRYLNGQTEIRARDLVTILNMVGIDVLREVDLSLENCIQDKSSVPLPVQTEVGFILQNLELKIRKTLLEQVSWWARRSSGHLPKSATEKLQTYIHELSN